jgi:carbamoyltransferase
MSSGYIAGIARGHNAGVCLLKDGEIVFSIEEERLTRMKYDGGPYASMKKILDYTDKIDYLVIAHTQSVRETGGTVDYSGGDVYTGLARKFGLIEGKQNPYDHPQVIDLSHVHHKLHAAAAFYRSGFKTATGVVIDGAGTFITLQVGQDQTMFWETESVFDCSYPSEFKTIYKHLGTRGPLTSAIIKDMDSSIYGEKGKHECYITERAGITKVYEAVTEYCGWSSIEAGKTMGLFPYGKENTDIPPLFDDTGIYTSSNRNLIVPRYPNGAMVNALGFKALEEIPRCDPTTLQSRRDMAYACQTQTQEQSLELIIKAVEMTGNKNVVLSGGYALNCVANYHYLTELNKLGINLYVEPVSNDAGTAMGAAMMVYHGLNEEAPVCEKNETLYLGPKYDLNPSKFVAEGIELVDATPETVVDLLTDKNIVAMFQGRSENGPRALGNRSILFDPTFEDGKDFVNQVKHREYFRPFAATVLAEKAAEWFDLRGMKESPSMMYAVNCKEGVEKKVPSVIHVDGTCRIQTVTKEQNENFYNLIKAFEKKKKVPMLFNTSFNLGGDPLVETLEDALDTLKRSQIEYLYLPEYGKMFVVNNMFKLTIEQTPSGCQKH